MRTALRVVADGPAHDRDWDEAWARCATAVFTQSRHWAEAWREASGGRSRPAARRLVFSDGLPVVVPLAHRHLVRSLGSYYYGAPAGTTGGWLAPEPLGADRARLLLEHLVAALPALSWRLNPFEAASARLAAVVDAGGDPVEQTQVIDLSRGYAAVRAAGHKGHKSAANKARREGVTIRKGSSLADWRAYYGLYRESVSRWGEQATSDYGWPLFDALRRRQDEGVDLWLAELGQVIAGAVNLRSARIVTGWSAAGRTDRYFLHPMDLLLDEVVRDACERGLAWFDLGPSAGHEGVVDFKRRLGASTLPAPLVLHERPLVPYVRRAAQSAGAVKARAARLAGVRGPGDRPPAAGA
jgi:hypothetical protein